MHGNFDFLIQLLEHISIGLCKETREILGYNGLLLRKPGDGQLNYDQGLNSDDYKLGEYDIGFLRFMWAMLRILNGNLVEMGKFLNMDCQGVVDHDALWLSSSSYFSSLRDLWIVPLKIELAQLVFQKTAVPIQRDQVPKIIVERLKDNEFINEVSKSGVQFKNKEDFIFTRTFERMQNINTTLLRPVKPSGTDPFICFEIVFKGENVMGEAGPYRQFFADISAELQPSVISNKKENLNLLCPTVNNQAQLGNGKDKFVINPAANSTYQLQLFEYFGILMGCSVRTGVHFTLDLPKMFWKQLVGQPITLQDLEDVDKPLCDLIRFFYKCDKQLFEESFQFENYTTMLSNKEIVELIPGGTQISVKFADRFDFLQKKIDIRINESFLQIEAIRKGINKLIPLPILNLISASDLEMWVCGKPEINFDLLKRYTKYSGDLTSESNRVKWLWEVLMTLKQPEKLKFVKFCWGQERLPANDEEFERTHTRFMIKPAQYLTKAPDKALPKADTCFFNLELPNYSTKEILREKLLIAINTDCDSMNAEELINLDPHAHDRGDDSSFCQEEID